MFECRLAALLRWPAPETLPEYLLASDWRRWERFYEQDPWGEHRSDLRNLASLLNQQNPETDVRMLWPYFPSVEEVDEQIEALEKRKAELPAEHEEKLKEARRRHLESKRGG